jgi:hypothetical protein
MPISQWYSKWYGKYHPLELTDLEKKATVGVRAFLQNHELTSTAAAIVIKSTRKTSKESTIEDYGRYWHDLYKFAVPYNQSTLVTLAYTYYTTNASPRIL